MAAFSWLYRSPVARVRRLANDRAVSPADNYECGVSFSLYAATVKEAPVSVTLDHFESLGDRMGSYNIESISPNVSGSILLKDCVSRGGAAPGLALREPPRYRCHLGCILLKMAAIIVVQVASPRLAHR